MKYHLIGLKIEVSISRHFVFISVHLNQFSPRYWVQTSERTPIVCNVPQLVINIKTYQTNQSRERKREKIDKKLIYCDLYWQTKSMKIGVWNDIKSDRFELRSWANKQIILLDVQAPFSSSENVMMWHPIKI